MKKFLVIVILIIISSCASKKIKIGAEQYNKIESVIIDNSFKITSNWAYPRVNNALANMQNLNLLPFGSTVNMLDLADNPNYVTISNDSVSAYLPYFGERQISGGLYNNNAIGIEFKGKPKDYTVNKTKNGYQIEFSIRDANASTESYDVAITVFPSLSTTMNINSSHRTSIQYKGSIDSKK